jgi:hypothetical protein
MAKCKARSKRKNKAARARRRLRRSLGAVTIGAVATGATMAGSQASVAAPEARHGKLSPGEPLEPSDELVQHEVEVRERFGFRHDEDFVRDLLRGPGKYGAMAGPETGGHYATPEEIEELRSRRRVSRDARRLLREARKDGDFAGLYIDRDGWLNVGFTRRHKEKAARLGEGADEPGRIRPFAARRSFRELEEVKNRIVEAMIEFAAAGVQVTRVAVDVPSNSVQVGIDGLDGAKRAAILARFGAVDVSEVPLQAADTRAATADPMRAGVSIDGANCTSAWKAMDRTTGRRVMLTAGHCADVGRVITQGTTSTGSLRTVGTVDRTTWTFPNRLPNGTRWGSGPVDAARFPLTVSSLPWLYAYDNANGTNGDAKEVESVDGTVVFGEPVCSAGQYSPGDRVGGGANVGYYQGFKNCGRVTAVNITWVFPRFTGSNDTFTIQNANQANYTSIPGDSGAPVWHYGNGPVVEAVGINSGGPTGGEVFNDIDRVENALNVDILRY